jgi:hypothetical protein
MLVNTVKDYVSKRIRSLRWRLTSPPQDPRVLSSLPFIKSLRDKYRGRRGFVIGNGPSLRIEDLDRLRNEITIASNKIFLAFSETQWRPTFHTVVDNLVWDKVASELNSHGLFPIITSYLPPKPCQHYTVQFLGNAPLIYLEGRGSRFSPDLSKGFYGGHSVTFENIQLAVYLGLDPIILIGCDHYYAGEQNINGRSDPVKHGSDSNHFVKNYRAPGEIVNPAPIKEMTLAYDIAARFAKDNGITILNGTRGGFLEAFPRCDFESLF